MSSAIESRQTGDTRHDTGCVVVLYNPGDDVVKNIASYESMFVKVVLVDNSACSNEALFADFDCHVVYVPLYKNTGIAHALNIGIEVVARDGISYAVTMDQDSSFETSVSGYQRFMGERGMKGILALSPQYRTDRESPKRGQGWEKVILTMQSGCLFSLEALDEVGGFYEDLFLDVVDWECFLRGHRLGWDVIQCNEVVLLHNPATTRCLGLGPVTLRYGVASPARYYYQIRNLTWAFAHYAYPYFFVTSIVKWAKILLLFPDKGTYIRYAARGLRDGLMSRLGPIRDEDGVSS